MRHGFDASEQMIPIQGNSVAENIEYKRIIDFAEEEGLIDPSGIERYFDDIYENLSTEDFYVRMIKMLNDEIVDDENDMDGFIVNTVHSSSVPTGAVMSNTLSFMSG